MTGNSCERLLLGTFLLLNKIWDYSQIQASVRPYPTQTENGLRHASGPVHLKPSTHYMNGCPSHSYPAIKSFWAEKDKDCRQSPESNPDHFLSPLDILEAFDCPTILAPHNIGLAWMPLQFFFRFVGKDVNNRMNQLF